MIALRRHGHVVGIPSCGPTRLSHHDRLPGGFPNSIDPALDEFAGFLSRSLSIKEGVAVDGTEIRGFADLWVIRHCDHGVDRHHGSVVAATLEGRPGLSDCTDNGTRVCALVDHLVTHADGANLTPVPIDSFGDDVAFLLNLSKIKDAQEKFYTAILGRSKDIRDLVTVGTVEADNLVACDFGQIAGNLLSRFASVVPVVWRV